MHGQGQCHKIKVKQAEQLFQQHVAASPLFFMHNRLTLNKYGQHLYTCICPQKLWLYEVGSNRPVALSKDIIFDNLILIVICPTFDLSKYNQI